MIEFASPELQNNESLKSFETADDLAKSFIDIKSKSASGSLELLPEELRNDETVKFYKDIPGAIKGLIETKKLVGTIKRPPASPADYKFSNLEGLHSSIKADVNFQKYLAENAHKLGLANDQADGVHKLAMGYLSQLYMNSERVKEETFKRNDTVLRQEWGADYDKNFNNAVRMLAAAGGQDVVNELGPSLKNAPLALKAFARIANLLSEDSFVSLGVPPNSTDDEVEEREYQTMREAIRTNDTKHPISNEKDLKHQEAVLKYQKLSTKHFMRPAK